MNECEISSAAAIAALEWSNQPGSLKAEASIYKALWLSGTLIAF